MERVYPFPGEYDIYVYRPIEREPVVPDYVTLYFSLVKAPIPQSTKPDKKIDQD